MKFWLSKYALTKGIIEVDAEYCDEKTDMIKVLDDSYKGYYQGKGINWHTTKEDAIERAEILRTRKIEYHKKQIEKLEEMNFSN